ncbi:response regulator [Salinimicrobium sp. GXAS 041]|uniref:response regulator n=1 Tax=Salinimicrobium sp. GXAS 041 TaxID=3400806 RepID=UPI003C70991D
MNIQKELKILMIDDHPIIIEGYKKVLLDNRSNDLKLQVDTANTCDEADALIEKSLKTTTYDLVFLDIGLPPSSNRKLSSGEDLGKKIREVSSETKLIVLTMFVENIRLLSILKSLKPEAFMIKSDVTATEFLFAFDSVLEGQTYSSQTVQDLMRKQILHDFHVDKIDRDILYHLSRGVKTKEIPKLMPVSLAAIEKRKKIMREAFKAEDLRDITLINKARELGFL